MFNGENLGGVQKVEAELENVLLIYNLHTDLPLGEVFALDGVPKILSMEIGVLAVQDLGLGPDQRRKALLSLEVIFD